MSIEAFMAAPVRGGLAAADVWHRLSVDAAVLEAPNRSKPQRLADLIADDKRKLAGKYKIVVKDGALKALITEYVEEYTGQLARAINRAYVNGLRIKSITVVDKSEDDPDQTPAQQEPAEPSTTVEGSSPAPTPAPQRTENPRKKEAQAFLDSIVDASRADTRVFPSFIKRLVDHGASYLAIAFDMGAELPVLHAIHPDTCVEVSENGVHLYTGHLLGTTNGITRINVWYPDGTCERCWCEEGQEGDPDEWNIDLTFGELVLDDEGAPIIDPLTEQPLRKPLQAPVPGVPIFMARTGDEVEGYYGYGIARAVYGLIQALALLQGASLGSLLYHGFPYIIALRHLKDTGTPPAHGAGDPDLTNPNRAPRSPGQSAQTVKQRQDAADADRKAGVAKAPTSRIAPGPGRVDEMHADAIYQAAPADVDNFLKREESFFKQISDTIYVEFDNLAGSEAVSGVAKRAKRQAFKDALELLADEIEAVITDGLEYALARLGFDEFNVEMEFDPFEFIDPTEATEQRTADIAWLQALSEMPPPIRIKLLTDAGYSRAEAVEWDAAWTQAVAEADLKTQAEFDRQLKMTAASRAGGNTDDPAVPGSGA